MITTNDKRRTELRGIADTSWHARAECHGLDAAEADRLFFPTARDHQATAHAKALCSQCPVKQDCFNYALENGLKEGTWAGLTEAERHPWHSRLDERLDYRRVHGAFHGRDVHLTKRERQTVTNHAYVRGWTAKRLAYALQISPEHARDLLRRAAAGVNSRDRYEGMYENTTLAQQTGASHTAASPPPDNGPADTTTTSVSFGKAA
jgi:hypothetical protein